MTVKMKIEITKMQLCDFEQIKGSLQEDFDDFWSEATLKQELENKARVGLLLHSSKTRTRNSGLCRCYQYNR